MTPRLFARAQALTPSAIAPALAALVAATWLATLPLHAAAQGVKPSASALDDRNLRVTAVGQPAAFTRQRLALVVGNAAYKDSPLTNPVNDARAIAQALRESGFSVTLVENSDLRAMQAALRRFGDQLRAGGTGLFYFAGHGMQIKGRNYLLPVGGNIDREDEVAYQAVDAQAVLDKMEAAGNGNNIMILDACRNNPFTRSMRSGQSGLAQMDAPVGTLVAFATSPGSVASDGSGQNGLYTQYLLSAMRSPGLKLEDVFKQVRSQVRKDSQGKQVPWESTSLEGDFYFLAPKSIAPTPAVDMAAERARAAEQAVWEVVKDAPQAAQVQIYLQRYPNGQYAAAARERIARLGAPPAAIPVAAAPAAAPIAATPSAAATATPAGVAVAPTASNADLQADVDRRTQELLAALDNPSFAPPRPAPARVSQNGLSIGDTWRFQVVDKFRQEVVSNYSRRVDRFEGSQTVMNRGAIVFDAAGNWVYSKNAERERRFSASLQVPPKLETGARSSIEYTYNDVLPDGSTRSARSRGELRVGALETIKTPAGEFRAWRVERNEFWDFADGSRGQSAIVSWYEPELRTFVATDETTRNASGSVIRNERHELTSYRVQALAR
jgi:uncharacterized caspase-like protein